MWISSLLSIAGLAAILRYRNTTKWRNELLALRYTKLTCGLKGMRKDVVKEAVELRVVSGDHVAGCLMNSLKCCKIQSGWILCLKCNTVQYVRHLPTFRRNLLSQSSEFSTVKRKSAVSSNHFLYLFQTARGSHTSRSKTSRPHLGPT
jgi:hypothetical protein